MGTLVACPIWWRHATEEARRSMLSRPRLPRRTPESQRGHRLRTIVAAGATSLALVLALALATSAAGPGTQSGRTLSTPAGGPAVSVQKIVGGLTQPVFLTNAGDYRLFVVERSG